MFIEVSTIFRYREMTIVLEPQQEGSYTVYVPSLPGCISQGNSRKEALKNIKEAIELYLESDTNELIDCSRQKVTVTI